MKKPESPNITTAELFSQILACKKGGTRRVDSTYVLGTNFFNVSVYRMSPGLVRVDFKQPKPDKKKASQSDGKAK